MWRFYVYLYIYAIYINVRIKLRSFTFKHETCHLITSVALMKFFKCFIYFSNNIMTHIKLK